MIPTRSRIERWTVAIDELHASSAAWKVAAQHAESASDGMVAQVSNPGGSQWTGTAADAAEDAAHTDRATAYRTSEIMRGLADRAARGADDIQSHHRSVLDYIAAIEGDGFIVGEGLSITDLVAAADPITAAQRQTLAEEHRGVLTYRAGALAEADAEVATALNAGAAELVGSVPAGWSRTSQGAQASGNPERSGVQFVDWKTDKPDPSPFEPNSQAGAHPQIGPFPVPPSVKKHEPSLPPPPLPPAPPPPWQHELDVLKEQLAQQGQTIEDLQTRLSPTMGIIASLLCGIVGGVLITLGSQLAGWFVIGGIAILVLAIWSLAVSVMKANDFRRANTRPR